MTQKSAVLAVELW